MEIEPRFAERQGMGLPARPHGRRMAAAARGVGTGSTGTKQWKGWEGRTTCRVPAGYRFSESAMLTPPPHMTGRSPPQLGPN